MGNVKIILHQVKKIQKISEIVNLNPIYELFLLMLQNPVWQFQTGLVLSTKTSPYLKLLKRYKYEDLLNNRDIIDKFYYFVGERK
jgi:hypothetical protein